MEKAIVLFLLSCLLYWLEVVQTYIHYYFLWIVMRIGYFLMSLSTRMKYILNYRFWSNMIIHYPNTNWKTNPTWCYTWSYKINIMRINVIKSYECIPCAIELNGFIVCCYWIPQVPWRWYQSLFHLFHWQLSKYLLKYCQALVSMSHDWSTINRGN